MAPATLLAETQRLHRYAQQRNKLSTRLLLFSLSIFCSSQLLRQLHRGPLEAARWGGLLLLSIAMLGFIGLTWWGTSLRQSVQPGLASRAYVQASLRAFRFRRNALVWLVVPYAALLSIGLLLLNWLHFSVSGLADWWKVVLWVGTFVALALVGRFFGLRKYEREFGPTVCELERWEADWREESSAE